MAPGLGTAAHSAHTGRGLQGLPGNGCVLADLQWHVTCVQANRWRPARIALPAGRVINATTRTPVYQLLCHWSTPQAAVSVETRPSRPTSASRAAGLGTWSRSVPLRLGGAASPESACGWRCWMAALTGELQGRACLAHAFIVRSGGRSNTGRRVSTAIYVLHIRWAADNVVQLYGMHAL